MESSEESGLSTQEALRRLHSEIEAVLQQLKQSQKARKSKSWIKDTFHHSSQHTTINWVSASFQLWAVASLFFAFIIEQNFILLIESITILFFLLINVTLELYDNKLRHEEVPSRVQALLDTIKKVSEVRWEKENYPNLCSPFSPCITLQLTYRDNKLVNLPWALLVKDDLIVIRPGQVSPGYCEAVDKTSEFPLLHAKEVYAPSLQSANEIFSAPKIRKPLENKKYRLLETPYLNNLRIYLEQSLDRPCTLLNKQRHLVMIKIIERFLLPICFLVVCVVNLFRFLFPLGPNRPSVMFLIVPISAILPLLPLIFPVAWNLLNYFGLARFRCILDISKKIEAYKDNPLEEDTETSTIDHQELKCRRRELWKNFVSIIKGQPDLLVHSANILHVLGSVTALGCVDKKGILSWPNPTAEKIFFLHNNENVSPSSSLGNVGDLAPDGDSVGGTPHHYFESPNTTVGEVLDLTHNHSDPFKLHFDDHEWHQYLTSLKPLGLAILLNTCNVETQEHYAAFCSHITCEAIYNENLVPVSNRRCLCELAKEIGFVDQAQKIFALEQQLSTFRHLQPEMVRRDNKYARTLQLSTKLKFPFPHMFAVVVKELSSGSMQLLSEGTADIILDSCVDYWDGHDLCPLTPSDRKKILDFYQRSSLTAYCTAFAYRPLNKCVSSKLGGVYLELPSDSRHLYMNYRSPTPVHWDCKSVLEPKIKTPLGQFFSTDSLLYNDCPSVDVSDAESCFQMQCNQVFIGMVTMQYQALTDMVQLIEQLERACIRFVHFSKENELRSRVFSEKMGLESGWNCHISLLSERNSNLESSRTMSFSAPSAINMEHSVVKFDTEQECLNKNSSDQSGVYSTKMASRDSVQIHNEINTSHDWQSLSCLTDSTEQSAPINFDMSNRAKLPRGIDKIRPHIELIDNVPLLVSLFTDCTPSATREMLNIMQDYGEIVCIMGSSANCENAGIFMQADASIAVDPLFPQMCQKVPVYQKPKTGVSPLDLSRDLNSIACSLCLKREDPISFYHLVMEARHFVTILWSAVQFWVSCCVILSVMQLVSVLVMLPPVLTTGQILWLTCLVVPMLSVSLMGLPVDPEVMKKPQGKNQVGVNLGISMFILWCYGLKFFPTVVVVIVTFVGILAEHCVEICGIRNCTCQAFYLSTEFIWEEESWTISTARLITVFIVLLHFVVISIGFVFRDYLIYKRPPIKNLYWIITCFILVLLQSIYTILSFYNIKNNTDSSIQLQIPLWVIIFAAISPFLVFFINELIKQQEIMVNKRFRKRARLDFGTKLGMNSPF
ncbi:transmembrane protein 94 isoform X2 [Tribolium madens]|uniref:transmembrane protein 94 isoform X2 n=1 Tax=Tribolium madens TaxID=41895 RepID=UPI001CF74C7C|nr:transmembrane protein 94 isoform X2 [Tribolium madens]